MDNKNAFEKLIVWKKAHQFVLDIYSITENFPKEEKYSLVNQLRRSSSSISTNISEGNARKSAKEFIQFLYLSKSSLSEVKYQLILAKDLNYVNDNDFQKLNNQANEIGKLINGLINYLKKKNNLKSKIYNLTSNHSFTLIELLITVALIAVIAVVIFVLLNPSRQIKKTWDSKRKNELGQLRKILEDWYNDKNCYPKPSEICYDPSNTPLSDGTYACHICGNHSNSPSFSPYLAKLPCDPQYPTKQYLYQVDNLTCPTFYRIYTQLSPINQSGITNDPDSKAVGCFPFCGPINQTTAYNYAVTSPNTKPESANIEILYFCQTARDPTTNQPGNCTQYNLYDPQGHPGQIQICDPSFADSNCGSTGCPIQSTCSWYPL